VARQSAHVSTANRSATLLNGPAAATAGIDLVSISPAAPKPSTVKGGYFQIEDFLSRVKSSM
jgi:hypothetical protein